MPPGGVGTYERPIGGGTGGTTALTLDANGHYAQSLTGKPNGIQGKWTFTDGKITFTETGGKFAACVGKPGKYNWDYTAGKLTLKPVGDRCQERSFDLSHLGPFTKRS